MSSLDDTFAGDDGDLAGDSGELRVAELAERAGTTVRNVRAYQDRGLLPPPRRQGRVAYYSDAHLARLRLIGELLDRGYSLASIGELFSAWEQGRDIGEVLGLEEAFGAPFATETPTHVTAGELVARFGTEPPDAIDQSVSLGLLVPEEGGYRVPSPRLLEVAGVLRSAGIPLTAILDAARAMREETDRIAALFVGLVTDHVIDPAQAEDASPEELAAKAEVVRRLRPLAEAATASWLAQAMDRATTEQLREHLVRRFRSHRGGPQAS